ncbi:hypothetical protein, partial [Bacillus tropicus]|uniref:hypothetical protein n=1 Tax=Bacillus tropicus TaxID=2026188 RepID=UPI001C9902A7
IPLAAPFNPFKPPFSAFESPKPFKSAPMPLPAPFVFGVFTDACLLSFTEEPLFEDLFRPSTLLLLPLVTPVQQQPPKAPPVFLADFPEDFGAVT